VAFAYRALSEGLFLLSKHPYSFAKEPQYICKRALRGWFFLFRAFLAPFAYRALSNGLFFSPVFRYSLETPKTPNMYTFPQKSPMWLALPLPSLRRHSRIEHTLRVFFPPTKKLYKRLILSLTSLHFHSRVTCLGVIHVCHDSFMHVTWLDVIHMWHDSVSITCAMTHCHAHVPRLGVIHKPPLPFAYRALSKGPFLSPLQYQKSRWYVQMWRVYPQKSL